MENAPPQQASGQMPGQMPTRQPEPEQEENKTASEVMIFFTLLRGK